MERSDREDKYVGRTFPNVHRMPRRIAFQYTDEAWSAWRGLRDGFRAKSEARGDG